MMTVTRRNGTPLWQRQPRAMQLATWLLWAGGAAIFVFCWQLISDKTIWPLVTDAPAQAADLAARMLPPDWAFITALWRPMLDTVNMADAWDRPGNRAGR